jgi:glutamyl-tRNA synthetase
MKDGSLPLLEAARGALAATNGFDAGAVEAALSPLPERLGVKPGRLYQPIRVAITGTSVSPGIFESLAALGPERSLERLEAAIERLRHAG